MDKISNKACKANLNEHKRMKQYVATKAMKISWDP